MAAFNDTRRSKTRAAHSMVLALAATSCAALMAMTLLLPRHPSANPTTSLSRPRNDDDSRRRRLQTPLTEETNSIRRRRLELVSSQCPRPEPKLPELPILTFSTYAASFPGTGYKLLTKTLVESLSGMLVGEAATSPSLERMKVQQMDRTGFARGQEEVIVLRTNFPHSPTGRLSAYDDFVPRAFVVLRSPLRAISAYFDEKYQKKSHLQHLPASTSDANGSAVTETGINSVGAFDAWVKWRDSGEFDKQLLQYREFVNFWMQRYLGKDAERVYFSYEDMVHPQTGPTEALRLSEFLEGGAKLAGVRMAPELLGPDGIPEAMGALVDDAIATSFAPKKDIQCVWNEIVHAEISSSTPPERPLTPDNLATVSEMLLELMSAHGTHARLVSILRGYHQEVIEIAGSERPLGEERPLVQQQSVGF